MTAALDGRAHYLKEYTLGAEALGRGESFDARIDPIVRVEASRLRGRLELYYATEGAADRWLIALPKGSYVPQFAARAAVAARAQAAPAAHRARARWRDAAWLAGGGALAAAFAIVFSFSAAIQPPAAGSSPLLKLDVALGAPGELAAQVGNSVAISPDGQVIALVVLGADGNTRLYARRLDALDALELEGTRGAASPFFSPDGRWVGFWAEGRLKKTLAAGGASPVTLADSPDFLGASWAEDGYIVAKLDKSPDLARVPENGGAPLHVSVGDEELPGPRWPQILPGGALLITTTRGGTPAIEVVRADGGGRVTLAQSGVYGRYLASGHVIYLDRGTLFAVPFDLQRLEARGAPVRVFDDIGYEPRFGFGHLDVARNGALVYVRSAAGGLSTIRWLDGGDASRPLLDEPARYRWPRLSPDASRTACLRTATLISGRSGRS